MYLIAGLSDTPGLEISSHVLSPIVFLKLKKSTGSLATDLDLLETIAEQVSSDGLTRLPSAVYINCHKHTHSHAFPPTGFEGRFSFHCGVEEVNFGQMQASCRNPAVRFSWSH